MTIACDSQNSRFVSAILLGSRLCCSQDDSFQKRLKEELDKMEVKK